MAWNKVFQGLEHLRTLCLLLLILVLNGGKAWGQTDFSGVWYIANKTNHDAEDISTHWYLVPGADPHQSHYADAYFNNEFCNKSGKGDYTGDNYGDPEKPFLTTYQTNQDLNSIWKVESTDDGYYNIIHALTGKYIVYEPPYKDDKARKSMHLESTNNPGDNAKFTLTGSLNGPININPKNVTNGKMYFNPATGEGNRNTYYGPSGDYYHDGMIGLWSDSGDKSQWYFEEATPITPVPTIINNFNGTITITGTGTIYYTTDGTDPTTSSSSSTLISLTDDITIIKAIAKDGFYHESRVVTYELPKCQKPVITVNSGTVTITTTTEGASIRYTTNDAPPTSSSTLYEGPFSLGQIAVIRAIAVKAGYVKSEEAYFADFITISSSTQITNMQGLYRLASDFNSEAAIGTALAPFTGTIDGQMNTLSDLDHPLVAYADGATIKNVILDKVSISGGTNAGAICNEAIGTTKIYNCGVKSGTISGTNAGSIVGKLDGYARVINCYSFATVSGGTWGAGIVGYNSFSSTRSDLRTMVMNCMFYGEISSNSKLSPIYGGEKITNVSNLNGYNYYRYDANYSKKNNITDYNCALAAEEKYLTRFEFFRNTLNSNRELAAWYATDNPNDGKGIGNACKMAKWVLDPADKPYPILKAQDYYPSFINYEDAPNLGTIDLTINESNTTTGGKDKPSGASINSNYPTTLTVYDKDLDHKHFNYRTVRLPYYNEVGTGNCTHNRVVTGWKITGFSGGTQGHFVKNVLDYSGTTHAEDVYPPYNFADRYCTDKDKYSVSGRVFSQGAYYDVPEGVTGITIEPYWGAAVYLSDPTYDVAYPYGYGDKNVNAVFVSNMGSRYVGGNTASINDDNQTVYTDYDSAWGQVGSSGTVYDNAIVLVGNYHHYWGKNSPSTTKAFTIMSADLNNDCEPDYSFIVQHGTDRQFISPIRFDFINSPGLGMIQKVETDKAIPKHGIWWPKGWFEVTNTTLIEFTQFEYDNQDKPAGSPLILLGGIYDQFITSRRKAANSTEYIHLGSNIWMKEFCNGTHTDNANTSTTRHIPISVTGGEFESFYLTGTFRPTVESVTDNAECYINGGKFGDMAGAGQEQLKGDVTWLIDHADITNFYGGGINDQKPVLGHIYVEINNSQVGLYCGGPKFGNMQDQKKVTTKAKGSTFGNFYGAGYGGTSYYRHMTKDKTGENDWDTWNADYTRKYVAGKGISTEYECEFIPYSGGQSGQADYVGRYYVLYASLSLAKTKNVESTLEDCHITGSFYGGGKLGSVDGNITSTLKNCTVDENVFGAGFSASVEKVNVVPKGALMKANPAYNESVGVFTDGVYPDGEEYTWTHAASVSAGNEFDETNKYIFTTADLTTLGTVTGDATLNIEGTTSVTGSVFGGGEESNVAGNTRVNISGGTIAQNVYGGGNIGSVRGSVAVNMIDGTVQKDVYGGGALADTQTSNWDAASNSGAGGWAIGKTSASATTTVRLTGGTIQGNAYGGGLGEEGKPAYVYGDVLLDLNGTTSSGETGTAIAIDSKGCVVNQVFGCNNVNGTPMGNVLVHVYATQNKNKSQIGNTDGETPVTDAKVIGSYDVKAVYGGGNLAAYKPAGGKNTTNSTNVIIDGCGLTSIQTVYGGGNAASTPATKVTVNGTFEIEELFGGGNGKDAIGKDTQGNDIPNPGANVGFYDYSAVESTYDTKEKRQQDDFVNYYVYGTGKASVNVFGGTIHRVFGGSNTKGNVRQTAVTLLDDVEGCTFCVDEAYGGGKSAPMDAEAKLLMSCIPGLNVAYGGAEAADIQGNVILNITNGKFDRVFGGNNKSGTIRGSITVNIEETGCKPIIIGELYGGGNLAGYSIYGYKEVIEDNKKVWKPRESESDEGTGPIHNYADPQINVKSFTSIGDIYGGGLGESALMVGSPTVNINVANGKFYNNDDAVVAEGTKTPGNYPIPSHAKGKIGAINNVFGGGNAAKVIGNTNVDIGTQSEVYVIKSVAVGDPVTDYFIRNFDGTYSAATGTAVEGTTYYEKKDVIGADIRGNVYGGGNNAEVTGNTNVQIGKKATE